LELPPVLAWLRRHPEVREVLVTGGDPLVLPTARLDAVLRALRRVPSIEILRIGTRVPVVLPQRVTRDLCAMLRRHHPVWMNTHFNHPAELTPESARACERLADAGIPVGNQAVLLRGVNDSVDVLERLFRGLVRMRVRPYYLLQCDPVRGTSHFQVPLRRALAIVDELRARLTGLAVPTFVVDTPGTAGKIPLLPTSVVRWTRTGAILRGPRGRLVTYRG
jgi:lysine 2,3-aminomutase